MDSRKAYYERSDEEEIAFLREQLVLLKNENRKLREELKEAKQQPPIYLPGPTEDQKNTGVYPKYFVRRSDGSSDPGERHAQCFHYVLDLSCDPKAREAVKAYLKYLESVGYLKLASDLKLFLSKFEGE